ncbi:hypothetical protein Pint_35163 [Pistacia integerrima]|uniref:Uncharacterized protein n=1 Tax=Pistacia integerrima TaxID=434235 RepID=A0ACC0XZV9_9ROSI|nr:hypothetical protein Pint_35163 [Pistacia integerrima]
MLQIIDPRLENQYSVRAAQKACSLAYYCLSQNPKARPLMSDVVETLEPLQCTSDGGNEVSLSLTPTFAVSGAHAFAMGGVPGYRVRSRFGNNVGPGANCRSPNPNCSPSGPAACRVRARVAQGLGDGELLQPIGGTEYRVMEVGVDNRRRLTPFQLCLLCKCCGGSSSGTTTCVTIPCCFGINCRLPNKPFGVCAFVPKTCNCTSCAHQI